MPNKYTDQQMIWAAQISYFNFTKDEIEDWKSKHQNEYPTVRELLLNRANAYKNGYIPNAGLKTDDPAREEAYKALYNFDTAKAAVIDPNTGEIADEGTRTNVEFINALLGINYQEVCEEYKDPIGEVWDIGTLESPDVIVDGEAQWYLECADWKVYSVKDHNSGSQSGLYALTLMPAEGEAIVAYRGSEIGIVDGNEQTIQFLMDWMYADGGLAYGTLTDQEKYAAEYLKMILDDENFTSVASSGHSLGGDLALTAAVISAYDDEKYVQGASFDGPGHPQKFMKLYADRIEAIQPA